MRFTAQRVGFGEYRILDSREELVIDTIFDLKNANRLCDFLNLKTEIEEFNTLLGGY